MDAADNRSLLQLKTDAVLLAVGAKPVNSLVAELEGIGAEIHAIGDWFELRDAMEAINDGSKVARRI